MDYAMELRLEELKAVVSRDPIKAIDEAQTAFFRNAQSAAQRRMALQFILRHEATAGEISPAHSLTALQMVAIYADAASWEESTAAKAWAKRLRSITVDNPKLAQVALRVGAIYAPDGGALSRVIATFS